MSLNLLEEEPLILDRLRERVSGVQTVPVAPSQKAILSVATIMEHFNLSSILPAALLMPEDSSIVSDSSDGHAVLEERGWIVFVAVGHVPDPQGFTKTFAEDAGLLLGEVVQALVGWSPPLAGFREMHYRGRHETVIDAGYVEYPLRFSVRRFYSAAC